MSDYTEVFKNRTFPLFPILRASVEEKQDVRVIPELIEANGVPWKVRDYDGYQNLVAPDVISTELQASKLSVLGIMIDEITIL